MTLEEKKQIYLDRFPAIISKRLVPQIDYVGKYFDRYNLSKLSILLIQSKNWEQTNEGHEFWSDIERLYFNSQEIDHQQILDIFHKHNIKP